MKQINIKNRTYYFYDIISLKSFESKLLKNGIYKNKINIYNIEYIKIKKIDDWEKIYCVNPLYLLINHASGYIEEENENKYLIVGYTDENKELLKRYNDVWNGVKNKIKKVRSGECDYGKYYMKIIFNSDMTYH